MKSHTCEFKPGELLPLLGVTLLPVALFAIVMHIGARANLFPTSRPALDAERTVIVHQVESARARQSSATVLIGDSSCLMNVSALHLAASLGSNVVNLATFSYLDLHSHGKILREFTSANPGGPSTVILLLHPETLRRSSAESYYANILSSAIAGREPVPDGTLESSLPHWLGVDVFRERLLSRALPIPLRGAFGRRYGFTTDLDAALSRERGCLIDPDVPQPLTGRPEYRLAPTLEKASRAFRSALPPETRLFVGITPIPETMARSTHAEWCNTSLAQWRQWLAPAIALTNLPATLPDDRFTRATHLRESAITDYTDALVRSLKAALPR